MKIYDSIGPNPRLVRMFVQEKGLEIDFVPVDLLGAENRRAPYLEKNPMGQLPCLELDDGTVIAETTVICDYLEELQPEPVLIGATAVERALVRMWTRRVEHQIARPLASAFRYAEGLPLFKDRIRTIPQAADDLKALAREGITWLDAELASGGPWIAGERFSLADIVLFAFLDFGATVGQGIDPAAKNVAAWFARVGERPSAAASA